MSSRLELRKYQKIDVERALAEFNGRVMLKHVQGAGKTVISTRICEDAEGVPHAPVVIICRTHLVLQWIKFLRREYPNASIGTLIEEKKPDHWVELSRERKVEMLRRRPPYDFYVLTFAMIRRKSRDARKEAQGNQTTKELWRDIAAGRTVAKKTAARPAFEYPLPPCKSFIVDESHHLRGRHSEQYAGAYRLAVPTQQRKAADRVVMISRTPAYTDQDDLWTQLRLLAPKDFRSYWAFVERYCRLEETEYGAKIVGGRVKRIARLLEKYAITREYDDPDVQLAVPDLFPEERWVSLTPASLRAYERMAQELTRKRLSGFSVGSGVADFARITASDKHKLEALDEEVEILRGQKAPFAIFSHYQDTAALLGSRYDLPSFSGRQTKGSGVNRFTRSERIKGLESFSATIGIITEGVDLSHLRHALFYEVDYSHGAMDQVRTRFRRWRQDNSTDPCRALYIIAGGTVDEDAYEAAKRRGADEQKILLEQVRRAKARAEG